MGGPGTGKSVLMFQLREELPPLLSPEYVVIDSMPPRANRENHNAFSLFRTEVEDFQNHLAIQLGLTSFRNDPTLNSTTNSLRFIEFLKAEMTDPSHRQVVLVDGLDEASDPSAIWDFLELLATPDIDLPLWFIVSSRQIGLPLGYAQSGWMLIDLDSERFAATNDAVVMSIIQRLFETPSSPYVGRRQLAEQAAQQIARRAGNSMLSSSLLVQQVMDQETPAVGNELETILSWSLTDYIRERLSRLGTDQDCAVAMLKVLAESENGLTGQELIKRTSYRGIEIRDRDQFERIMSQISVLLIETESPETRESVYEFGHQAIRDMFLSDVF